MVPEQRNLVTVATRTDGSMLVEEDESSESDKGVISETWPKRRPSTAPAVEEKRWIKEAKIGPEIATFCKDSSSMADSHLSSLLQERDSALKLHKNGFSKTTCGFLKVDLSSKIEIAPILPTDF